LRTGSSGLEDRVADAAPALQADVAALGARLAKDRALNVRGNLRQTRARDPAERYEAIDQQLDRAYSCINAATMWLSAGERGRSAELAQYAQALCRQAESRGEAEIYCRRPPKPRQHWCSTTPTWHSLRSCVRRQRVSTSQRWPRRARQLLLICELKGIDAGVLDALPVPAVIRYCGHIISAPGEPGRFPASAEREVLQAITAYLAHTNVDFGFGSLACGADILFAEALPGT
jgi:hypothetical protein